MKKQTIFKKIKQGKEVVPTTAWEWNYLYAYNFKSQYKGCPSEWIVSRLRTLCEIKLDGNPTSYRKRRKKKFPTKKPCFVCRGRAWCHHHIIQLQNGGYNSSVNRIPICEECHKKVHDWL